MKVELRCTAPHPVDPRRSCHAKLADVLAESVRVEAGDSVRPGCVLLRCRRCGTEYVICPLAA